VPRGRLPDLARDRVVPPPGLQAVGRPRFDSDDLARDRGRRAPLRRGERAGAGTRPLRRLLAMWNAWAAAPKSASARNAAISYAAYRVLLWQASFDSNLGRTFAQLTRKLRALCYSPDFTTSTEGGRRRWANRSPPPRSPPPGTTVERIAALRRSDLHVSQPAPDLPLECLHRGGFDLLDPAGARNDPAAQPYPAPTKIPSFVGRSGGTSEFRAPAFASRPADRPGCATVGDPSAVPTSRRRSPSCGDLGDGTLQPGWSPLTGASSPRTKRRGTSAKTSVSISASTGAQRRCRRRWGAKRAYSAPRRSP
jgi:hypothetical protein